MVEADVIKSILEDNGIRCILWDSRIGTVYPVVEIRVMVEEEDLEKAEKIIRNYQQENKKNENGK
jgi:tRNA A37 threonylcarbamoyladenosine biosynthesis protein TsaE